LPLLHLIGARKNCQSADGRQCGKHENEKALNSLPEFIVRSLSFRYNQPLISYKTHSFLITFHMTKISIVYHSGYGHTKTQAEAVAEGAKMVPGAEVTLYNLDEARAKIEDITASDAVIFGAPTYMGSMSGPMKVFMDELSKMYTPQTWRNKIAGGFTSSSNLSGDKLNTLTGIFLFAMQMGMIWAGVNVVPGTPVEAFPGKQINRLGGWIGAMAQSNKGAPGLQDDDGETAKYLGKRIAEVTARLGAAK
jgi:multimeric flavodoxin WrbA